MSTDQHSASREETLLDVLERIRADRYPEIDRELVRDLLRLHAEPAGEADVARTIDELISARGRA